MRSKSCVTPMGPLWGDVTPGPGGPAPGCLVPSRGAVAAERFWLGNRVVALVTLIADILK